MSQPADSTTPANISEAAREHTESLSFALQIVSPSVEVTSPLTFPRLPVTTSIKELKAKIRDVLPSKPADENQRLIHRGRMLAREAETMLDIFGQETLASTDVQALHLVLRPATVESVVAPTAMPATESHQPTIPHSVPSQIPPRPLSTPAHAVHALHPALQQGMHVQQPLPGFQPPNPHQLVHQVEHIQNMMGQRLQQLQRETQRLHHEMTLLEQRARAGLAGGAPAQGLQTGTPLNPTAAVPNMFTNPGQQHPAGFPNVQAFISQQQRARAAEGLQGIQGQHNNGGNISYGHPGSASGRASPSLHRPEHTTTYTREGIGPNGERWQMTVNEASMTIPLTQPNAAHHHLGQHGNPALDLQALLRNADRFNHNNVQRSTSNPTLHGTPPVVSTPGITRPGTPGPSATGVTTNSSPSASAPLASASNAPIPSLNLQGQTPSSSGAPSDPMVYVLSSSSGPRALLVNNTETFYTPRQSRRPHAHVPAVEGAQPVGFPEYRNRRAQRLARRERRANEPLVQPPLPAPHANPGAGAMAAQMGPLLWLIVRLVGFVWFFTAGNQSWTRWLMVSGLALFVFIMNTGVLNGVAEQLLGPVRRHLENLIPLAGPDAALAPGAPVPPQNPEEVAAQGGLAAPRRGEPDPAQVAARLLEQHRRNNGGWIVTQMRRMEHAALLFLASLVPGVGERHIAAREAEANAVAAERQRQIEVAAAAQNVDDTAGTNSEPQAEDVQENRAGNDGLTP